jgi:hypothetical protein
MKVISSGKRKKKGGWYMAKNRKMAMLHQLW